MTINPADPAAKPRYTTHARLVDGVQAFNDCFATKKQVSRYSGHHENTVSRVLDGERAKFIVAHHVFNALNSFQHGVLRRSERVLFINDNQDHRDDQLESCLVFPRLSVFMTKLSTNVRDVSDETRVHAHYIDYMIKGLPVADNLIMMVFDHMNARLENKLDPRREVFN